MYNIIVYSYKKVNKNFFKKWSFEMAYVLGFFAADGYITVNRRGGQFWCFDIGDEKLIKQIRKTIKSTHKISTRKRSDGKYTTYRLQIGSSEMCDDLRRLGFSECKTNNLAIPYIPKKYFSDFVRGYFDGDGHVWVAYINKNRKKQTLVINTGFTSCSLKFLEALNDRLEVFNSGKGTIRQGNGNSYRLNFNITGSLNLYKFMYNGMDESDLFLSRKKVVFEKFIKMRL